MTPSQPVPTQSAQSARAEGVESRLLALAVLTEVREHSAWASPVLDRMLNASDLDARDRAFTANLAFSTLRFEGTLDWILVHLVSRGLEQVETSLIDLLRLGTWELRYGAAPSHATVNAWVEVARIAIGSRTTGFVNGILRNVARKAEDLPWPAEDSDAGIGLQTGYPAWIVGLARERFGFNRLGAVLEAGNTPAPLILRSAGAREPVLARLAEEGIAASAGSLTPHAIILHQRHVPGDLAVIRDGSAIVQDQSSQFVGMAAADGLPPGASAIDLCAAPGGKTTYLAQMGLQVTAVDRHAGRLRRTVALASRLGMQIDSLVADGAATGLEPGAADLTLVDAPCSGFGVVRRRPELRWRKVPTDVTDLAALQTRLLRAAVDLTRPGGRIVYSVCTWTEAETDSVVMQVLGDGTVNALQAPDVGTPTATGCQLASDTEQGDGMFLALLQRKG